MNQVNVIEISDYRGKEKRERKQYRRNARKKGRVYSRSGKLWVDFKYLGERVRERSGLDDTPANRRTLRSKLDLIVAEIENGVFAFAKRFPHSRKKDHFTMLEGRTIRKKPEEVLFGEYVDKWWEDMRPGMSESLIKDYTTILKTHHLPYFSKMTFSEICSKVRMKKYVAHLKGKKNRYGQPLSAKRIQNVMIPLRVIVRDAMDEYDWPGVHDPFTGLRLPKVERFRVEPFSHEEWNELMTFIHEWYRPYFELAIQTGLRPSEQVALKWSAIDQQFLHIELSRVNNREKTDLKTRESRRSIRITRMIQETLDRQRALTAHLESPYVFLNTFERPILQDKLRELWERAMKKSGLKYRRMYETRHTFASWALAAGETPEWVAKTLGHVGSAMVFRTYGRYIPNLTRQDGSAFERQYSQAVKGEGHTE